MGNTRNFRNRIGVLVSALALVAVGTVPLLGTAQDAASPQAGTSEERLLQEGQNIYENVCLACHQPDGMGIRGIYLPLNNNPLITSDDPTYFVSTVLTGRGGMPAFAGTYSDEEIAAITTYVRQAWDNDAGPVDVQQVAEIREEVFNPEAGNQLQQDEETSGTPIATPEDVEQEAEGGVIPQGTPEVSPPATPQELPQGTP